MFKLHMQALDDKGHLKLHKLLEEIKKEVEDPSKDEQDEPSVQEDPLELDSW